jgi:hypothetical protein
MPLTDRGVLKSRTFPPPPQCSCTDSGSGDPFCHGASCTAPHVRS